MIKYTCICPLLYSEAVRNVQKEIRKFRKLENIPHKESLKEWVLKRENWNYSKEIMYSLYPHFIEQDIIGLNCTKVKQIKYQKHSLEMVQHIHPPLQDSKNRLVKYL